MANENAAPQGPAIGNPHVPCCLVYNKNEPQPVVIYHLPMRLGDKNGRKHNAAEHAKFYGTDLTDANAYTNANPFPTAVMIKANEDMLLGMISTVKKVALTFVKEKILNYAQLVKKYTLRRWTNNMTEVTTVPVCNMERLLESLRNDTDCEETGTNLQYMPFDNKGYARLFENMFLENVGAQYRSDDSGGKFRCGWISISFNEVKNGVQNEIRDAAEAGLKRKYGPNYKIRLKRRTDNEQLTDDSAMEVEQTVVDQPTSDAPNESNLVTAKKRCNRNVGQAFNAEKHVKVIDLTEASNASNCILSPQASLCLHTVILKKWVDALPDDNALYSKADLGAMLLQPHHSRNGRCRTTIVCVCSKFRINLLANLGALASLPIKQVMLNPSPKQQRLLL